MEDQSFRNLIQERFVRKAADLLKAFQSAASIQHGPTRGQIREAALCESLALFTPPNLSAYTGFVLDAYGSITPQLDIIFARHESLSPILLEGNAALVPIETFALSVEVKSTLTTNDLNGQIAKQAESLQKMQRTGVIPNAGGNCYITFSTLAPMCVVAYNSEVAISTLQTFVENHEAIQAITVITGDKKCSIVRNDIPRTELTDLQLILRLWAHVFHLGITLNRRPQLSFKNYKYLEEKRKEFLPDMPQEWFNEFALTPPLSAYIDPPTPPNK